EGGAVHTAVAVSGFAVAFRRAQFNGGVFIQCPAQLRAGAPAGVGRMHFVAIAVFVIIGIAAGAVEADIALVAAGQNLRHLIITAKAAAQQADITLQGVGAKDGLGAFYKHRARVYASCVSLTWWSCLDGGCVLFFGPYIGGCWSDAVAATAEYGFTCQQIALPRGRHTPEYRFAMGSA